ncbi:MAG: xanthine dehydrogenase family protein subunit M [Actinobacteria bacterium]|nr:xanthine dehydrogenase family protein subunit M [Actinomycetota bacterium]OJU84628.1 MAG: carbon monoxide dehydrogenase [Solirubrobacterales bacterium 70-9]
MQVPAPFEYERATSVDHALQLLVQLGPESRILAGGYSLLPMMKLRLATPKWLIDIDDLADELGYVEEDGEAIRIGAMTRHRDLLESPLLARLAPIFRDAELEIADPVVRNRGTIGGALCQADPSEDLSAVCTAVDAEIVVRSLEGDRILHMEDFYRGPYQTAVAPEEIVVEIRVPTRAALGSAYEKINRRVGDWAVAAAGAALTIEDGAITDAGIALVAVGAEVSSAVAREALIGQEPTEEVFEEAAAAGAAACNPITDQRGSAEYKRHAVGVLAARAMGRAAERLGAEVAP